jgi:hypothetical protein
MLNAIIWAGSLAGALLAVGALVRVVVRRLVAIGHWTTAALHLPAVVADLSHSVTDLSVSVADLSRSVDGLQHPNHRSLLESL